MNEAIKLIFSLSISGSLLAGILFFTKPFIKHKLSKSIQYYIWIVVLLRLVVPFSFDGSIMNHVFYGNPIIYSTASQSADQLKSDPREDTSNSMDIPNAARNISEGVYKDDSNHSRYFIDLFNQYVIYIWLCGVMISLTVNATGYIRFSEYIKKTSRPALDWEIKMLSLLLNGRNRARLLRNSFVKSPILLGIFRPVIILPDTSYSEIQLKNILLHESIHLKRYDIVIKWFSMIVTSIHWFNPLMYVIKKEINHAGELSCDEAVILNLSSSEKQQYGETLISVAAENKYPAGVIQATFSEDKNILKDRLVSIMRYNKKSSRMILLSIILILLISVSAVALGASTGIRAFVHSSSREKPIDPPQIVIFDEGKLNPNPIDNYRILISDWNGVHYDNPTFYQAAWKSEPTLLTGLHRLKPGEKLTLDFGSYSPDKVTVKSAYLTDRMDGTETFEESHLPIMDVPVTNRDGKYEFINPPAPPVGNDFSVGSRVFSITAEWGRNVAEYVFASDGKFDDENDDALITKSEYDRMSKIISEVNKGNLPLASLKDAKLLLTKHPELLKKSLRSEGLKYIDN